MKFSFPTVATSELSQRLFGSSSTFISTTVTANTTANSSPNTSAPESSPLPEASDNRDTAPIHLPTILGLKIRAINTATPPNQPQPQPQAQAQSKSKVKVKPGSGANSNSLLKQQLRGGAKDPEVPPPSRITVAVAPIPALSVEENPVEAPKKNQEEVNACSGLQSLATAAAEQQAAAQAANSSGSLHHQLLHQLHLVANNPYIQQQQQVSPSDAGQFLDDEMSYMALKEQQDNSDGPDHELLTLADENAGLPGFECNDSEMKSPAEEPPAPEPQAPPPATSTPRSGKKGAKRPIQRRRVRRKAQSTIDDQAEHLTEMSVRGLDLFRYASVVEGVYRCTECAKENMQKTFKNKYSFQRHAFLYHEGKHRKVFPCPVCSKEFSRPDKMKNHLKMTHENFTPPKDLGAFSPLKYLISAAAAGDMHATIYQQQQQQEQAQYQRQLAEHLEQQERLEQQDRHNASFDSQDNTLLLSDVKLEQGELEEPDQEAELSDGGYDASNPAAAAAAMLSLQHDVIIKNEIQISPSPSPSPTPPPPASCAVAEGTSLALATTAQTAT